VSKRTFEYSLDTTASAKRVIAVLTDFSDRRPEYFPALSRRHYKVMETGDKTALVREGTAMGWAIERYDWSKPGVVSWTLQDSNLAHPGTIWEMRVTAKKGGGAHIDVHMERDYKGPLGLFFQTVIVSQGGGKLMAKYLKQTLDILEKEEEAGAAIR
jgi:hypothetical protein